jgi:chaperonin GroES
VSVENGEIGMSLRPLHDRIIVERMAEDEKTSGGLFIPESAKEKPQRGKVVAVGKGKISEDGKVRALDVKAGDTVLFGKYSGTEVKIDNKDRLIMREDDILAVIE